MKERKERVEQSFVIVEQGKDKIISGPYDAATAVFIAADMDGIAVLASIDEEGKLVDWYKLELGGINERPTQGAD